MIVFLQVASTLIHLLAIQSASEIHIVEERIYKSGFILNFLSFEFIVRNHTNSLYLNVIRRQRISKNDAKVQTKP